jgi:hypothetical protein
MSEILQYMCRYFSKDEYPELLLKNSGLFDLIKMGDYEDNLIAILFPIDRAWAPPLTRRALSRTLNSAFYWFEGAVLTGDFDKIYGTKWVEIINNTVITMRGTKCQDREMERLIEMRIVFFVVFYSVLRVLTKTGEIDDYCEFKGVI